MDMKAVSYVLQNLENWTVSLSFSDSITAIFNCIGNELRIEHSVCEK